MSKLASAISFYELFSRTESFRCFFFYCAKQAGGTFFLDKKAQDVQLRRPPVVTENVFPEVIPSVRSIPGFFRILAQFHSIGFSFSEYASVSDWKICYDILVSKVLN